MYYEMLPAARRAVEMFFGTFGDLMTDAALREDSRRLKGRLAMRDKGSCCVGFKKARPQKAALAQTSEIMDRR